MAFRGLGLSSFTAAKRIRSVSPCGQLSSGFGPESGKSTASAAPSSVVDSAIGTSRDPRFLRSNIRASLMAIRVNQVENKESPSNFFKLMNAFWKLCCTTSSASSRLRVMRCAIEKILPSCRWTRSSNARASPVFAAATSAVSFCATKRSGEEPVPFPSPTASISSAGITPLLACSHQNCSRLTDSTDCLIEWQPRLPFHFGLAMHCGLTSKIEMNRDFHFDSDRGPIKQGWLILPLQHRLQRRGYQERVAAHRARSHHVSVLIDHGVDYHGAPDVRLHRNWRLLGLDRIRLPWCFDVGTNVNNSPRCGLLRRRYRYGGARPTKNSTEGTPEVSSRHPPGATTLHASQVRRGRGAIQGHRTPHRGRRRYTAHR